MSLSPEYLTQLKALHASQQWGASGYSHAPVILQWMKATGSKTVLDFGCGRATLKPELVKAGIRPERIAEYDPAIEGKDAEPFPADMLVANDVLEHIEQDRLITTLERLRYLARRAAYFTIALTPSKVSLPDGRNAHITLMGIEQWRKHLQDVGFDIMRAEMRKGWWVWAR